jgi:hypothetical protein
MTVTWRPPARPEWVRRLDAHGPHAGAPLTELDPDRLLDAAVHATGLTDFGDDGWRTHFDVFMDALDREWRPTTIGALMTRTDILRALVNRLELTELWRRRPGILDDPVPEPLVIVGAARSGTSILHELLTLDPDHRSPTTWTVHRPLAAATGDATAIDAARREVDGVVRFWHDVQPEYEAMHHNHGDLPTECIFLTVPAWLSDNWAGTHTVPSYDLHLATSDHTPAYRWHRRVLQTLQPTTPGRRWVLKAPSHLPTLRQLFTVYPDARVVHIHRDPAKTLPSMFDLMGTLKWMRTDHVDLAPFVEPAVAGIAHLQHRAIRDRADGTLPDERFHDLRYADLIEDPVAAVGGIYDGFGWSRPTALAETVTRYLDAKPRGAKGHHRYALADFGLTADGVRRQYAPYLDRFAVPREA